MSTRTSDVRSTGGGSIPHGGSEFLLCLTLVTRRKTSLSVSLMNLKLTTFPTLSIGLFDQPIKIGKNDFYL